MKLGAKLRGKFVTIMLATMMGMTVLPTTAFAQVKGDVNAETEAATEEAEKETEEEKIGEPKEEVYGKTEKDLETTEPMDPLTPDGNLSLVDDLGMANGVGKQFITVVTKTGNYFYIIIDRDDEGEGTVHFLNQVDEADIFKLLSEEEQEEYIQQMTETPEPEIAEPEPEPEPEVEPEPEKKPGNMKGILGIIGILALAGAGGGYYLVNQSKKKQAVAAPDPDADYMDEEDPDSEYIDLDEDYDADEETDASADYDTDSDDEDA